MSWNSTLGKAVNANLHSRKKVMPNIHIPNKILAVATECRLLKKPGNKFVVFHFKNIFCLKAPRLCTPFDTASSPLSAILTESSSVSDCLRSLDAGPRTTSNKCYFFMHECVSKNGKATHAVSTWHLVYARIQTLLYIYSRFVDLIKVPFALLIFFM